MIRLQIMSGAASGEERVFAELPLRVGRDAACPLRLDDPKASRNHASLERRGQEVVLVDLGSSNGSRVNGRAVDRQSLAAGDEIVIGSTRIRVLSVGPLAAPPPGAAPQRSEGKRDRLEARLRRRRRAATLGPAAILLLLGGGAALWLWPRNPSPPPASTPLTPRMARLQSATEQLERLRSQIMNAPRITEELLARTAELDRKFGTLTFPDGSQPIANFFASMRFRHELETGNEIYELARRQDELLSRGDYGKALRHVRAASVELLRDYPLGEARVEQIRERTRGAAKAAFARLQTEATYLENLALSDECLALYERGLDTFAGTEFAAALESQLRELKKRTTQAAERRRARLAAQREAARREKERRAARNAKLTEGSPEEPSPARRLATQLARTGRLDAKSYAFDGFEGQPREFDADGNLTVQTAEGVRVVPCDRVPAQVLVGLALDLLDGEFLLETARFAHEAGLLKQRDRLLLKYLRRAGPPPAERSEAVSRIVAELRGIDPVPEGGFTYAAGHGWESASERTERVALDEAKLIAGKVAKASSQRILGERFGQLRRLLVGPKLSPGTRSEIRAVAVRALSSLRENLVQRLSRKVNRSAFARLRLARQELQKRRERALQLIYDTGTYLPENHEDHPRGDKVNGQAAVDEAVAAVRELWENAGSYAVALDPQTAQLSEMVRFIDSNCYADLRHRPAPDDEVSLDQIRNNIARVVDLRRFALNRSDLDLYRYNRKVEAFNRQLPEAEVPLPTKGHVGVVNDYREMLGRRRLFIDARLCRATSKHSKACSEAGRIWHHGPDGSPGSRARAEGFEGGVAENVAIGYSNPSDIWWRGWYRASDHHRNALGASWTCVGYGYVGTVGTQNFAVTGTPFE